MGDGKYSTDNGETIVLLSPQVRNMVGNEDEELVDPGGHPLPPCIVMEKGEALDLWSGRNAPDRAQAFTVRLLALLPCDFFYLIWAQRVDRVVHAVTVATGQFITAFLNCR